MFGKLIDYPADTVKTRLQTERASCRGPLHCAREMLRESGIAGFYRGIPTPLICAVTECATMFSSWAMCCNLISGKDTTEASLPDVFIAGAMSGFFVAPFVTPLELIKCKYVVLNRPILAAARPELSHIWCQDAASRFDEALSFCLALF